MLITMITNRVPLNYQERAISSEEGKRLADKWNAIFLETSAKQNEVSAETRRPR